MAEIAVETTKRGIAWRAFRFALAALFAVLILPYLLVPLYAVVEPISTLMIWRSMTGQRVERSVIALADLPDILPRTVIVAEDARFCRHHGIDFEQIKDAIEDYEDGASLRGGSTITQQVVKNLFLWPGRSVIRKALEAPLALWMDLVLPKRRILEIYLNIAEWGPTGEFGADAGAQRAFGKSARSANAREAALLAAILPNPRRRNANRPGPAVTRIAGIYQTRTARAGRDVTGCLSP